MTNVTVQEALKADVNFIESVHSGEWSGGNYSRNEILTIIESALSDIGKCEPVAILHRKLVEVYNPKLTLHEKADITFLNTDEANKESEMRYIQLPDGDYKLYTSPISKEWVGLTKERIEAIVECYATDYYKARAIERELKQLNAEKG